MGHTDFVVILVLGCGKTSVTNGLPTKAMLNDRMSIGHSTKKIKPKMSVHKCRNSKSRTTALVSYEYKNFLRMKTPSKQNTDTHAIYKDQPKSLIAVSAAACVATSAAAKYLWNCAGIVLGGPASMMARIVAFIPKDFKA